MVMAWWNKKSPVPSFTLDQLICDVSELCLRHADKARSQYKIEILFRLVDDARPNACAYVGEAGRQYCIDVNSGLIGGLYNNLTPLIRKYYKSREHKFNVSEDLFARMVLYGACSMAFWHEFIHVVRGHVDSKNSCPAWQKNSRLYEIDADIFGAQHLLLENLLSRKGSAISDSTWNFVYVLSIRGLYSIFDGVECDNEILENETHPHPVSRAYLAVTHGLARSSELMNRHDEIIAQCLNVLLDFEEQSFGFRADPKKLKRFMDREIRAWSAWGDAALLDLSYPRKRKSGRH